MNVFIYYAGPRNLKIPQKVRKPLLESSRNYMMTSLLGSVIQKMKHGDVLLCIIRDESDEVVCLYITWSLGRFSAAVWFLLQHVHTHHAASLCLKVLHIFGHFMFSQTCLFGYSSKGGRRSPFICSLVIKGGCIDNFIAQLVHLFQLQPF